MTVTFTVSIHLFTTRAEVPIPVTFQVRTLGEECVYAWASPAQTRVRAEHNKKTTLKLSWDFYGKTHIKGWQEGSISKEPVA